jgi:Fe2+ transport system protein B
MEHVTGLVATLDRRFDTSHSDLKEYIAQRFIDTDLRYQQRFDAQTKALDAALAAQKEAVQTALVAAEKATMKAEQASEKRFDSVNAFRETLTDQTATFIPRSEAEARLNSISEKVDDLKLGATTTAGRSSGLQSGWGYLLAGVSVIVLVVNFAIALATH